MSTFSFLFGIFLWSACALVAIGIAWLHWSDNKEEAKAAAAAERKRDQLLPMSARKAKRAKELNNKMLARGRRSTR